MGSRVGLEPDAEVTLAGDDEPALVARCRAEAPDHAAFRALYERHVDEVLRFLRRLLGAPDAVEDGAQETFVRLHRGLRGDYDPARPVRPYVLGIARNVAIEAFRRREKLALPAALPRQDTRSAGDAALARERSALVQDALNEARDVLKLLTLWLPREHPDRALARQLLESVIERLKGWRRGPAERERADAPADLEVLITNGEGGGGTLLLKGRLAAPDGLRLRVELALRVDEGWQALPDVLEGTVVGGSLLIRHTWARPLPPLDYQLYVVALADRQDPEVAAALDLKPGASRLLSALEVREGTPSERASFGDEMRRSWREGQQAAEQVASALEAILQRAPGALSDDTLSRLLEDARRRHFEQEARWAFLPDQARSRALLAGFQALSEAAQSVRAGDRDRAREGLAAARRALFVVSPR